MYIAGTALLAYLQTMLRERKILREGKANYKGIPDGQFCAIVVSHFVLLAALIAYNLWRGSL
jgi:hypothetical protein